MRIFALLISCLAGAVALPAQTYTENWELTQFSEREDSLDFQARSIGGAFDSTYVLIRRFSAGFVRPEQVQFYLEVPSSGKNNRPTTMSAIVYLEKTERGYLYKARPAEWTDGSRKLSKQDKRRVLQEVLNSIWNEWSEGIKEELWPFLREIQ